MQRKVQKYLWDVRTSCESLTQFVAGKSLDDDCTNVLLRLAIERVFTIIGEAVTQALKIDQTLDSYLTDARKIVGFRNQLIHGYHLIDNEEVWNIIQNHVPLLLAEVRALVPESSDPLLFDEDDQ